MLGSFESKFVEDYIMKRMSVDEWYKTLSDDERWSHCGNRRHHSPHTHTIVFNEGPYPGSVCIGVPSFVSTIKEKSATDSEVKEWLGNVERQIDFKTRKEIAEENNFPKFYCTFEGGYLLDGHFLIVRAPSEDDAMRLIKSQFMFSWTNIYREEEWLDISNGNMRCLGEF